MAITPRSHRTVKGCELISPLFFCHPVCIFSIRNMPPSSRQSTLCAIHLQHHRFPRGRFENLSMTPSLLIPSESTRISHNYHDCGFALRHNNLWEKKDTRLVEPYSGSSRWTRAKANRNPSNTVTDYIRIWPKASIYISIKRTTNLINSVPKSTKLVVYP